MVFENAGYAMAYRQRFAEPVFICFYMVGQNMQG
jgi:hypothetical protein